MRGSPRPPVTASGMAEPIVEVAVAVVVGGIAMALVAEAVACSLQGSRETVRPAACKLAMVFFLQSLALVGCQSSLCVGWYALSLQLVELEVWAGPYHAPRRVGL